MHKLNRNCLRKTLPYVFIILVALSIVSYQIIHPFFINGVDSFFHMSVTYDTFRQIKSGNFSYFLSAFGFYHSLRIVNAVYGPLGGYFSGLVLLITGNWIHWEITMMLMIFIIAGISMYQLCQYWHVIPAYGALISSLYMLSFPIMSMWLNSQYDGFGAAFIPWTLYFGSKFLNQDNFKSWKLVILLVILAEVHVFSFLLGLLVLILCVAMALIINRNRRALMVKGLKILLLTAGLSFNIWGGIIEVIASNHNNIIPTYYFPNMFQNVWGALFYNQQAPLSQNLFLLGLSATILIVITAIIYLFVARYLNLRVNFIMIALGLGFLWLSSRLFPWPTLQSYLPILDTGLQFPKRFLPVSLCALGLILGIMLTVIQHHLHNHVFIAIIFTIFLGMFTIHAWQNTQYQSKYLYHQETTANYYGAPFYYATKDEWLHGKPQPRKLVDSLSGRYPGRYFQLVAKATPDYLPSLHRTKSNLIAYGQYNNQIIHNQIPYHLRLAHHVIRISFKRNSARIVTLPWVKYAHTQVSLNGKLLNKPKLTPIGALELKPKKGDNVLTFKYVPAKTYKIMMWASAVIWMLFIIDVMTQFKIKRKY